MNILEVFAKAKSKSDVCRLMGWSINGTGLRRVNGLISEISPDISHFDNGKSKRIKWRIVNKECPVCNTLFEAQEGHPREKQTCSCSCSNTFFRSGQNNPNYKDGSRGERVYRTICFEHYEYICSIPGCDWDIVVDVHHIDGNHDNNDLSNLIPLCPNHHKLVHMNQGEEIRKLVKSIPSLVVVQHDS